MTTITCKCKAVEIEFNTDKDLFRLQCCCHDCNASVSYAAKRGGPQAPAAQWVDSSWYPNDFTVTKGENKIGAFLNFENADTTRFYCKECWTLLFGDHVVYDKKLVVTQIGSFKDFDGLKNTQRMDYQARHFIRDVPDSEIKKLPAWTGDPSRLYQSVADVLMESFPEIQKQGAEGTQMNAQILLEKIGPAFVPSDDRRLTGGPPTLIQQAWTEDGGSGNK